MSYESWGKLQEFIRFVARDSKGTCETLVVLKKWLRRLCSSAFARLVVAHVETSKMHKINTRRAYQSLAYFIKRLMSCQSV